MQQLLPKWMSAVISGDRLALGRAITAIEDNTPDALLISKAIYGRTGRGNIIGVTGPPGAGKSTLISAITRELRQNGRSVAIVAIDPSSPFSGGAILGDRLRMVEHAMDEGVFIRSLATRGHLGGLSQATLRTTDLLDAAGFDSIIVETVGAGQSEIDIAGIARVVLLVVAPGLGDDIQAIKAGILEIADFIVVNKADAPGSERTYSQLRSALSLVPQGSTVQVFGTVASSGKGVPELLNAVAARFARLEPGSDSRTAWKRIRTLLSGVAARRVSEGIEHVHHPALDQLCNAVLTGELDLTTAAERAISIVLDER